MKPPWAMPRPLNRRQSLENQAFLRALARTGNARDAARTLGVHRATFLKRRAKHPAFAAEWDAALALAHATFQAEGPAASPPAEPQVVRLKSGRLQLRRPTSRRLDRLAEQRFLAALSATANVRLSAAAAGFSHSAFYARRRESPAFAREMRMALELGYDRIELALLESYDPFACRDDAWRHNDPPPIPSMSADQALQLLKLHHREARLWAERPDRRPRRGESGEAFSARMAEKARLEQARVEEEARVRAALDHAGRVPDALEPPPPALPALDQVTGWSATGRPHKPRPRE